MFFVTIPVRSSTSLFGMFERYEWSVYPVNDAGVATSQHPIASGMTREDAIKFARAKNQEAKNKPAEASEAETDSQETVDETATASTN